MASFPSRTGTTRFAKVIISLDFRIFSHSEYQIHSLFTLFGVATILRFESSGRVRLASMTSCHRFPFMSAVVCWELLSIAFRIVIGWLISWHDRTISVCIPLVQVILWVYNGYSCSGYSPDITTLLYLLFLYLPQLFVLFIKITC